MSHAHSGASVTVRSLLETLRDALTALVPMAEHAGIAWREGEAYDDWDDLASTLYEVFVVRPISTAADASSGALPLAPYDLRLPTYEQHSALIMRWEVDSAFFFNKLLADDGVFGSAEALPVALDGRLLGLESVVVPIASVPWGLLRRYSSGAIELVDTLAVNPDSSGSSAGGV